MTDRKPGIRFDGGKRRDLNKERVAGRMAALPEQAPTSEQTAIRRKAMQERARMERKAAKIGHEGAITSRIKVRDLQGQRARSLTQTIRCRPGTFEWRYGRNRQDAYFHAGNHFAILWERAGIALQSSAQFLRGIKSGYAAGISDGRVAAIDSLRGLVERIGHSGFERLMAYCVHGKSAAEIASLEMQTQRNIATILHNDLRQCAIHFKFLGVNKCHSESETN